MLYFALTISKLDNTSFIFSNIQIIFKSISKITVNDIEGIYTYMKECVFVYDLRFAYIFLNIIHSEV